MVLQGCSLSVDIQVVRINEYDIAYKTSFSPNATNGKFFFSVVVCVNS
jgi:hypothetical protein